LIIERDDKMANVIEFFRMVLSYLMVFGVIVIVSAAGYFVGIKCWKPTVKVIKKDTNEEF